MPMQPRICFDRVIPPSYQPARAQAHSVAMSAFATAVKNRLADDGHAPLALAELSYRDLAKVADSLGQLHASDPINVARMAVINQKKWSNAYTLRCRFLDGSNTQRSKVEEKAKIWEKYANISLSFGDDTNAEVRISFVADSGSWSAIGNDCLVTTYFPLYQPTMNFGWLRDDTDDTEYERVVVHEFGHALGCIHEHQSPNENLQWNTAAVYAAFAGPPNFWSKDEIDQNILEKYSPDGISATRFDPASIMLYQFDSSLFLNGQGTPNNTQLSAEDEQMIAQMYPHP